MTTPHIDHQGCAHLYVLADGSTYCGTHHQSAAESKADAEKRLARIKALIAARLEREAGDANESVTGSFF